jgi:sulfopyruvate decarboxylase subunit alpha
VTDVVGLPDNSSAALFALLSSHPQVRLRTVTREGEAFALAAGLWMGGARPIVLIQNTGLLESGDSLRGTVQRMKIPIVCVITYRGHTKMMRILGSAPAPSAIDAELIARNDLDSVALVTEPTLAAWGLACDRLAGEEDLPRLTAAFRRAESTHAPAGLLLVSDLTA